MDQTKWDKVVSNIFYFHPHLGKWSILTTIFQMGWNHQLEMYFWFPRVISSRPSENGTHLKNLWNFQTNFDTGQAKSEEAEWPIWRCSRNLSYPPYWRVSKVRSHYPNCPRRMAFLDTNALQGGSVIQQKHIARGLLNILIWNLHA